MTTPSSPAFTVLTCTHNRGELLRRAHASLLRQSDMDFEWVIIDDGSTDGTRSIVDSLPEAPFSIRYFYQPQGGKHAALNHGTAVANGTYIIDLDDDDELTPDCIAIFRRAWASIPEEQRGRYQAVQTHCIDQHGKLVGKLYPLDHWTASKLDLWEKGEDRGEKHRSRPTSVLRRYPHPTGMPFVHLATITDQMEKDGLLHLFVNEVTRVYWDDERGDRITRIRNMQRLTPGMLLFHGTRLNDMTFRALRRVPKVFARSATQYVRFALHAALAQLPVTPAIHTPLAWLCVITTAPAGAALWALDLRRARPRADVGDGGKEAGLAPR